MDDNIYKIGLTKRDTLTRSKELSNTSVPDKFMVVMQFDTSNCVLAEQLIHKGLIDYRLSERREFFKVDFQHAVKVCQTIVDKVNEKK